MPDEKVPATPDPTQPATPDPKQPPWKKQLYWIIPVAIGIPIIGFFGLCCACGGFGMIFGGKDKPAGGGLFARAADANVPADQAEFIKQVESFTATYKSASNELKKSAARGERRAAIQKLVPNRHIKDWVGTLTSMGTNRDGNAHLEIRLQGSKISVKTWNNALSDIGDRTLITNGSDLFRKASALANGKKVTFSGEFVAGNLDFVKESSMTERGSMTDPAFILRFEDITAK